MTNAKTWLLHLSDIHFHKPRNGVYDPYDLDVDLRDQLEIDIGRLRKLTGGPLHGIVLSGDVSFSSDESEFDIAIEWLRRVAEIAGCEPSAVFCVPGNHDADRGVFSNSVHLRNLHDRLRQARPEQVDALLSEYLNDSDAAATLFRPLEKYNNGFAAKFTCRTQPDALVWEHRLKLNDASLLVLRGTNTVLVSNSSDDNQANKLVLGTLQATARDRPNEAVVLVGHHPPDWLLDADQVRPILGHRARVQLFGHKHAHVAEVIDNSLRVVAGAVHPDRREPGWLPRYNGLGFSVVNDDAVRHLSVTLFPRVWQQDPPSFGPDYSRCAGAEYREYTLALPPWECPDVPREEPLAASQVVPVACVVTSSAGVNSMDQARALTYRFLTLPHVIRLEIAQSLRLIREEDEGLFDADLIDRILVRAARESRLGDFGDAVESRYEEASRRANPYRTAEEA